MKNVCGINGCREDLIWGLIRADGKLARFSFSKNLLEFLNRRFLGGTGSVQQFQFRKGKELLPGEASGSGIYAIIALQGSVGRTLRVCYTAEQAEFLSDPGIRGIAEFWLMPPVKPEPHVRPPPTPRFHLRGLSTPTPVPVNNRSLPCPASPT